MTHEATQFVFKIPEARTDIRARARSSLLWPLGLLLRSVCNTHLSCTCFEPTSACQARWCLGTLDLCTRRRDGFSDRRSLSLRRNSREESQREDPSRSIGNGLRRRKRRSKRRRMKRRSRKMGRRMEKSATFLSLLQPTRQTALQSGFSPGNYGEPEA